ncbi:hypothetical protein ACF0H5_016830 [Mactra antiquata]
MITARQTVIFCSWIYILIQTLNINKLIRVIKHINTANCTLQFDNVQNTSTKSEMHTCTKYSALTCLYNNTYSGMLQFRLVWWFIIQVTSRKFTSCPHKENRFIVRIL